jgi:hypothetical protein
MFGVRWQLPAVPVESGIERSTVKPVSLMIRSSSVGRKARTLRVSWVRHILLMFSSSVTSSTHGSVMHVRIGFSVARYSFETFRGIAFS